MSNYKHFKHYYNPYDSLDVEWQHVVSKGYLTIGEIICLSGYTKSYIYRLVKNGVIPSLIENDGRKVKWTDFVHWYSHLCPLVFTSTRNSLITYRRVFFFHLWLNELHRHGKKLVIKFRGEI